MSLSTEKLITNFRTYANQISETVLYGWSDEFCRFEVGRATNDFLNEIRKEISFKNMSLEDATILGFKRWDEDLYLIPLYLAPIIPVGLELESINGETVVFDGNNIDLDNRFGMLAYGIRFPNKE